MKECVIGWEVHPTGQMKAARKPPPPLIIPIRIGQHAVTALLDTGSSVPMVQAHLVPKLQPTLRLTTIVGGPLTTALLARDLDRPH